MNDNPNDPNKDSKDELERLIKELEAYSKKKQTGISYVFLLHKNYVVHIVLSFVVNLLMAATVIGLSIALDYPLVQTDFQGFLLAITILTLMENLIKILLFRYALKLVLYSLGTLSWLVQFVLLYVITLIVGQGFTFLTVWDILIFSILFTCMRFILSVYIRRWFYQKDHIFMGGKKWN